jgi:hypothetical protein
MNGNARKHALKGKSYVEIMNTQLVGLCMHEGQLVYLTFLHVTKDEQPERSKVYII